MVGAGHADESSGSLMGTKNVIIYVIMNSSV